MVKGIKVAGILTYQKVVKFLIKVINFGEPEILSGPGSVLKISNYLKNNSYLKPLIVTDKGIIKIGLMDQMLSDFKIKGIDFAVFDDVIPNPTIEVIEDCANKYKSENCDCFIGFGGGSSMDAAKVAAARVSNPGKSSRKMAGYFKIRKNVEPIIAVPTTAGTGSEATVAAVVTDAEKMSKFAIGSDKLLPLLAVLDPELTAGLPSHITSATGMDALTHAIEAYISTIPTPLTDEYARKAVKLIFENLSECVSNGSNIKARENMLMASYYAGASFTRALVGNVHAIAHNFGGLYHVPHGLANAIVLPHILEASVAQCDKRLAELAELIGIENDGKSLTEMSLSFIQRIREMNAEFGIPETVKEMKIEDISLLARRASKEAFYQYAPPKYFSAKEMEKILEPMLA